MFLFADFLQNLLYKKFFKSNGLDPEQDPRSVGPDLGPNCLQRLSADNKIKWPLARTKLKPAGPLAVGSKEGVTVLSGT